MKILVVEDEHHIRQGIVEILAEEGYKMLEADSLQAACDQLSDKNVDAVLSDIRLPDGDGFDLLQTLKTMNNPLPCILMTAFGNRDLAEQALRNGAYDYISKPIRFDELLARLMRLKEKLELERRLENMATILRDEGELASMGNSSAMRHVRYLAAKATTIRSPVLIQGERGVGKRRLTGLIHMTDEHGNEPFVQFNCSSTPDEMMESELFGYKQGALPGTNQDHEGRLSTAGKGTLFLDEISELPLIIQSKLLHVLDNGHFQPLGDTQQHPFHARIITTTNKDLRDETRQGRFREDLYFCLDVLHIHIPPLRERRDDIAPLATSLLEKLTVDKSIQVDPLDTQQLLWLQAQDWPGNARELRNTLERALLLANDGKLNIPPRETHTGGRRMGLAEATINFERSLIMQTIEVFNGDKEKAAGRLGIGLSTLYRKLEE
ncbi:MAG: sigma-54 dependent transcriptional regulator [Mariprofundaceae bacterium]|nr:sigma-54 dependent transcriptional regulator [Mariprofundaceae bacterium]